MFQLTISRYADYKTLYASLSNAHLWYAPDGNGNFPAQMLAFGTKFEVLLDETSTLGISGFYNGETEAQILQDFPNALNTSSIVYMLAPPYQNGVFAAFGAAYPAFPRLREFLGEPDLLICNLIPGSPPAISAFYLQRGVLAGIDGVSDINATPITQAQIQADYPHTIFIQGIRGLSVLGD